MIKQVFPTSFGQQRLWFLDQIMPGTAAYNLARVLRFSGSLNQAVLAKALQAIIARHESLRTIFVAEGDQVRQVVSTAPPAFDLSLSNLSELPVAQRELAALRVAGEETGKPFDLSRGPLLRVRLFRLGPEEHILLFVIHHIIADGWSMNLLFHEMAELYAGFATGSQPSLAKLNFQYADYARWQRNVVTSDFLAGEIEYWKNKLDGAETVLRLPTDYPRPAAHSGRGRSIHFNLSQETNKSLKALAQSENATLFMVLLAVFQILLARYTSQSKILIGTPTAGRTDVELENLIGFFVGTLILRGDIDAESSFRQMLRQTRANTLEALAHQNTPFEKLVEAMEPDRNLNRNPLFQVMFILQNAPKQKVEIPGLAMQEIEFESGVAKFDLTLEVIDLDDVHCTFEYDSDLYRERTIQRMAGHFVRLVERVVAAPDEKLTKFSLLSTVEVQQLEEWNETSGEYPRALCIHTAFEEQAARTPHRTAVFDEENNLSYLQLNDLANRLARRRKW
jgi:Condensation domain